MIAKEAWDAVNTCTPYHPESFIQGYIAGAEPREKRIDELKAQIKVLEQNLEDTEICENGLKNSIADLEDKLANADYQLEGRDNEIRELKNAIEGYKNQIFYKEKALAKVKKEKDRIVHRVTKDKKRLIRRNIEYKAQIEKMKCCYNCSKWNDGQCADVPNDSSYYSADFVCKDWEIKEK